MERKLLVKGKKSSIPETEAEGKNEEKEEQSVVKEVRPFVAPPEYEGNVSWSDQINGGKENGAVMLCGKYHASQSPQEVVM